MALLDIFQLRVVNMTCLSPAAVSFLAFSNCIRSYIHISYTVLSDVRFFELLQKSSDSTCGNPCLLWNVCLGDTLMMQYNYIMSCCCAQSCHGVWFFTVSCLQRPHLVSRVWLFPTPLHSSYTAVSVLVNCVSTYKLNCWLTAPVWYNCLILHLTICLQNPWQKTFTRNLSFLQ